QAMVVEGAIAGSLRGEAADAWKHAYAEKKPALGTPSHPIAGACARMIALGRDAEAGEDSSADKAYAQLFRAAKNQVRVMTPNLNDDHALSALADATADADVYVVLSKGFNDSTEKIPSQGGTNEENVSRLAGDAKNPCNLHIRWFSQTQGLAIDGNGNGA